MKLLLDAGNTRVKWALYQADAILEQGAVHYDQLETLAAAWRTLPISTCHGSTVVREEVRRQLEALLPVPVKWVVPVREAYGIRCGYTVPQQLGADRWLAMIAARHYFQGPMVVVCAGTGVTVDALTTDGEFLGGSIMPGMRLMQESLARNTARLAIEPGDWHEYPQNSPDAMASGIIEAIAGCVMRAQRRLADHVQQAALPVIITGGDAERIAPYLAQPVCVVDNLVLKGLLQVAEQA